MKTIVIWDTFSVSRICFAVLDGDCSRFNEIYVNSAYEKGSAEENLSLELENLEINLQLDWPYDVVANCDAYVVIVCGSIP